MATPFIINQELSPELREAFENARAVCADLSKPLGLTGQFVIRASRMRLREMEHTWGPTTGKTSRSLTTEVGAAYVLVGTNVIWGALLQMGGVVVPRAGKFLAIPVADNLRRGGVWPRDLPRGLMRYSPNAEISVGSHHWTGPALVRKEALTRPGKARKDGSPGKERTVKAAGEVMFALIRRATIRAHKYLAFDAPGQAFLFRQLDLAFIKAWRSRQRGFE